MASKKSRKPAKAPTKGKAKTPKPPPRRDKRERVLLDMTRMSLAIRVLAESKGHRASTAYARNRDGTADTQVRILDWSRNRMVQKDQYIDLFTEITSVADISSLPSECRVSLDFGASDVKGLVNEYLKMRSGIPSTHSKERLPSQAAAMFASTGPAYLDLFKKRRWKLERISLNLRYDPTLSPKAQKKRAATRAKKRKVKAKAKPKKRRK